MNVQDCDPRMAAMAMHWPKIDALLGGTPAMRRTGVTYLPQQPNESNDDYAYRVKTSTLFPAFERACGVMAGKPFSKELTLNKVPAAVEPFLGDIDGQGRSLHAFASEVFTKAAVQYGFGGILVDFTKTLGEAKTAADEKRLGARPYWVFVTHDRVLGYKAENIGSQLMLTQLRLSEVTEIDDGKYGTTSVNRVRVLRPGGWELLQEDANGYSQLDENATTLSYILFVPLYGLREGFMVGKPALSALADLNIKYWQQQSDQDDSARFARKRLLVFTGLNSNDPLTIASDMALRLPPNADAKVVQGSAESVTVGRTELAALEQQMIQTGAELLVATPRQGSAPRPRQATTPKPIS